LVTQDPDRSPKPVEKSYPYAFAAKALSTATDTDAPTPGLFIAHPSSIICGVRIAGRTPVRLRQIGCRAYRSLIERKFSAL
jgi:hypothetical protein